MLNRSIRKCMAILMLLWTPSCSGPLMQVGSSSGPLVQVGSNQPSAPVVNNIIASSCSWERPIVPSAGFAARLTRDEKEQIVAHNAKVAEFCSKGAIGAK